MLAGTTYPVTIKGLGGLFVGFLRIWLANAGGSTWHAPKAQSRFESCGWTLIRFGNLSSNCCRQYRDACGECRRNYM
jgi:hypothetical protein